MPPNEMMDIKVCYIGKYLLDRIRILYNKYVLDLPGGRLV